MSSNLKIWRESASLILAAKSVFSQTNRFNYKILSLKRSSKSPFMPDYYVFPGGNVSNSDRNLEWFNLYENFGFSKQSFNNLRPVENVPAIWQNDEANSLPKYLSFRICAIRETFEECGVLLCKSPKINSDTVSKWASFIGGHEFKMWQKKVQEHPDGFFNMCKELEIFPDVWALKNWSNWRTPPSYLTLKFNTIFFLATLHQMPAVQGDEREIQDSMWTTPDECLQMADLESVMLPVPQFYEMSRLKVLSNIETLADFAEVRNQHGFETYWPHRVNTDEGTYSILPGDDLYPGKIDADVTDIPHMIRLPGSQIKHRIFHKSEYVNHIEVENFTPKCNHIAPSKGNKL